MAVSFFLKWNRILVYQLFDNVCGTMFTNTDKKRVTLCFLIRREWKPLEFNYNLIANATRRSTLNTGQTLQVKLGFAIGKERYCQSNHSVGRVIFSFARWTHTSDDWSTHRTRKGTQICCDTKVVLHLYNVNLSAVPKYISFDVRDSINNQYAVNLSSHQILGNHWIGIAYVMKWSAKNINPCSFQQKRIIPAV